MKHAFTTGILAPTSAFIGSVVALIMLLTGPVMGAAETCETSKAKVKRCEHVFPASAGSTSSPMKTIVYTDRYGNVVDWEINFPTEMKEKSAAVILIDLTMGTLTPSSTAETRSKTFRDLVDNAVRNESRTIPLGKYNWASSKMSETLMMRASAKPGQLGDLKKRGVDIGMTADEVRKSSWGKPQKVNTTITAAGSHEQWVYGRSYLYLENGIVTSIQTSR